jgi:hypothetical protein
MLRINKCIVSPVCLKRDEANLVTNKLKVVVTAQAITMAWSAWKHIHTFGEG